MIPRGGPSGPPLKLLSAPVLTYTEAGETATIDWAKGNHQHLTLGPGAAPCVVTSINLPSGGETADLTLAVRQDGVGGRTIAFVLSHTPGGAGITLSSGANETDLLDIFWTGNVQQVTVRGLDFS